jgi:hypothetical protein
MKLTLKNQAAVEEQLSKFPGAYDLLLNLFRAETASDIQGYLDAYDQVANSNATA